MIFGNADLLTYVETIFFKYDPMLEVLTRINNKAIVTIILWACKGTMIAQKQSHRGSSSEETSKYTLST